LLSNLYMRRFVLGWKKLGHEKRLAAYIVNYADDLVICCRDRAEEALARMRDIMTKLKLTVNETKTRVCKLPEEKFDFLGYTFGRCYSPKTGRAYIGTVPSKKRVIRVCEAISETTGRDQTLLDQEIVVAKHRVGQLLLSGQSAMPTTRWKTMPAKGYVSGCVPSTKSCRGPSDFRGPPYTTCWV